MFPKNSIRKVSFRNFWGSVVRTSRHNDVIIVEAIKRNISCISLQLECNQWTGTNSICIFRTWEIVFFILENKNDMHFKIVRAINRDISCIFLKFRHDKKTGTNYICIFCTWEIVFYILKDKKDIHFKIVRTIYHNINVTGNFLYIFAIRA